MKKHYRQKHIQLLAGLAMITACSVGTNAFADDAYDIESGAVNTAVVYDNYSGAYPVITAIGTSPGSVDGYTYTTWSFLAQDPTGSIDIYASSSLITSYTPTVGDAVKVGGYYSPYQQIPEIENNATHGPLTTSLQGTPGSPGATVATIPAINVGVEPQTTAGYYLQLNNVTITAVGGGAPGNFPTHANASYTITDGSANSMTMYFWASSYSADGAMGGMAVPTGTVDVDGFVDIYTPTSGNLTPEVEFVPLAFVTPVPEPSVLNLAGVGGLVTLVCLLRKKA